MCTFAVTSGETRQDPLESALPCMHGFWPRPQIVIEIQDKTASEVSQKILLQSIVMPGAATYPLFLVPLFCSVDIAD